MNQGQMDHMQLEAMAAQAKESRAKKDAMVRDKSTGEASVSPKPVAQKITTDDLHALISRTEYTRLEGTTKTFCHIFIGDSGFSVTGESACLNPADFDEAVGRDFAFKDAFNKLWPLEGYHRMRGAVDSIPADFMNRAAGQCCGNESIHDRIVAMDQGFAEKLFCYIADLVKQIKKDSADMAATPEFRTSAKDSGC